MLRTRRLLLSVAARGFARPRHNAFLLQVDSETFIPQKSKSKEYTDLRQRKHRI